MKGESSRTGRSRYLAPGRGCLGRRTAAERNALLLLSLTMVGGPFGEGTTAPCARLYLIDDNGKIKNEQVVFYLAQD